MVERKPIIDTSLLLAKEEIKKIEEDKPTNIMQSLIAILSSLKNAPNEFDGEVEKLREQLREIKEYSTSLPPTKLEEMEKLESALKEINNKVYETDKIDNANFYKSLEKFQ
ncbi:hypothetical protein SNEBB_001425 [Seison nebaliae]|nr:hypothetical protein SNEBB_001425 [Seison nebaliae]